MRQSGSGQAWERSRLALGRGGSADEFGEPVGITLAYPVGGANPDTAATLL